MKLWQVAPFFHSLLVRFVIWKEKRQLCIFSFQIRNLTKSEWKKRGNLSEFHSERSYYLQNWYFRDYPTFTGKSLSEALIFASTNPQYDDRLFIELQRFLFTACSPQVLKKEEVLTKIYLYQHFRCLFLSYQL